MRCQPILAVMHYTIAIYVSLWANKISFTSCIGMHPIRRHRGSFKLDCSEMHCIFGCLFLGIYFVFLWLNSFCNKKL